MKKNEKRIDGLILLCLVCFGVIVWGVNVAANEIANHPPEASPDAVLISAAIFFGLLFSGGRSK